MHLLFTTQPPLTFTPPPTAPCSSTPALQLMVVVPVIIPVFLPLGAAFFYVRSRYLATSRDVKRFEAVTRSPVYSSFSAILKVGCWSRRSSSMEGNGQGVDLQGWVM